MGCDRKCYAPVMTSMDIKSMTAWLFAGLMVAGCNGQSSQVEQEPVPTEQHTEIPQPSGETGDAPSDEGSTVGKICGTRGATPCAEGEYCAWEAGADCGRADAPGTCQKVKSDMMCTQQYDPVCGCDGKTHGNACSAAQKGVGIDHKGECEASGEGDPPEANAGSAAEGATCGGIAGIQCADGLFCNYEKDAGGLGCDGTVADASGVCQRVTKMCTREYKPVCGCDHLTYPTACVAHSNGVSVLRPDMCTEKDCEAAGGRVAMGTGAAPKCNDGERSAGPVRFSSGAIPTEGALCCLSK